MYEALQRHLQNDRQQRYVLKLPPSGDLEGSYVTRREFKDASSVGKSFAIGTAEWSQSMIEAIDDGFQQSDQRTAEYSNDVYCLPANQFVFTDHQLEALKHCVSTDSAERYNIRMKAKSEHLKEPDRHLIYRRTFNPDSPRAKVVADAVFKVLSTILPGRTVTIQQTLNHREIQAHGILSSELESCLRKNEGDRFEVTPPLPSGFFQNYFFNVRNKGPQPLPIQPEVRTANADCKSCQQVKKWDAPIVAAVLDVVCDRTLPACTRCTNKGMECWYTPPNKCIWCTDMGKDCDRGEDKCSNCAAEGHDCRYRGGLTREDVASKCVWCTDMSKACDREQNCGSCRADGIDCRWR